MRKLRFRANREREKEKGREREEGREGGRERERERETERKRIHKKRIYRQGVSSTLGHCGMSGVLAIKMAGSPHCKALHHPPNGGSPAGSPRSLLRSYLVVDKAVQDGHHQPLEREVH
jgi:hypothetical protein